MEKAILDTDTFSELLRAKNPTVSRNGAAYRREFGCYTISAVTVVEVAKGFQQVGRTDRLAELIASLATEEIVPLDGEAAIVAGQIYGELERTGQTIGRADPMIAGIALSHGLTLVTGNTQHFERIVRLGFDLRLDDWRK